MPQAAPQHSYEQAQAERQRLDDISRSQQEEINTHVKAITDIRASMEGKVADLQRECDALQRVLRRSTYDDVSRYLVYQAAQARMAGVLSQGLKRATAADKFLEASRLEREERTTRERQDALRDKVRAVRRNVASLQRPTDDDFDSLYEEVSDAS